jgi:hypothetical protein
VTAVVALGSKAAVLGRQRQELVFDERLHAILRGQFVEQPRQSHLGCHALRYQPPREPPQGSRHREDGVVRRRPGGIGRRCELVVEMRER